MNSAKRILILDDHDSIRMLLGTILSQSYDVYTKKDGLDGLAWLGEGNIPDLIILDLNMPQLSGIDFLKNLRNSGFYQDIPVIVLSSSEDQDEMDLCHRLGIAHYFIKPFNPIVLKEKIVEVIAQYQPKAVPATR